MYVPPYSRGQVSNIKNVKIYVYTIRVFGYAIRVFGYAIRVFGYAIRVFGLVRIFNSRSE